MLHRYQDTFFGILAEQQPTVEDMSLHVKLPPNRHNNIINFYRFLLVRVAGLMVGDLHAFLSVDFFTHVCNIALVRCWS